MELKACAIDGTRASEDEATDVLPQTSLGKFNCGRAIEEVSLVLFSIIAIVARQPREVYNCVNPFKQRGMPIEFEDATHDELKKRMVKNRRHRARVWAKAIEAPNMMTLLNKALAKNRAKVAGATRDEDSQHYFPFTSASNQLEVIRKSLFSVVPFSDNELSKPWLDFLPMLAFTAAYQSWKKRRIRHLAHLDIA